jgi:hypothetical protein
MENEICTISIGNGIIDDDYTFFDDGRIKRIYDMDTWNYNLTHFVTHEAIPDSKKEKIIEKCPTHYLPFVRSVLRW